MQSPEFYKERTENSIREGFFHKKGEKEWPDLLRGLGEKGKYEKMVSAFRIVKEIAPEMLTDRILKFIQKKEYSGQLPFNPNDFEFKGEIDKGGEHKVYLLESLKGEIPSYVLKVNHLKTGDAEQIKEEAIGFKKEYERVKKLYASIPGIVPEEATMVATDPQTGEPRIATIQRFNGHEIRDFLEDFDHDELISLLVDNSALFDEARKFFEITEKEYETQGFVIDLIGKKNLSIVKNREGEYRLLILDPHNSVRKDNDNEIRHEEQEMKILRLKRILEKAEKLRNSFGK